MRHNPDVRLWSPSRGFHQVPDSGAPTLRVVPDGASVFARGAFRQGALIEFGARGDELLGLLF